MACYLRYIQTETFCSGCSRRVPVGFAGFTDEILEPRLTPVCAACLYSLSEPLWRALMLPRVVDVVLRLIKPGREPEDLAEELEEAWGALRNFLPAEPQPKWSRDEGPPLRLCYLCGCTPPRKLYASRGFADLGPIVCGLCESGFAAAE